MTENTNNPTEPNQLSDVHKYMKMLEQEQNKTSMKGMVFMRKCPACGAEMEEGFKFSGGFGNVIRKKGKAVYPEAAVCPNCGEISIYVEDKKLDKLTK